jgi:hypothetical protein
MVVMVIRGPVLAIVALALALPACDPLGLPATRALESGAAGTLSSSSFEISGSYTSSASEKWTIDMQLAGANTRRMTLSSAKQKVEAIIIGKDAYFRGQQLLASKLGQSPDAPGLVQAAGNAWWKDTVDTTLVPAMPDFTDGPTFRATFLGSAVTQRRDHVPVGGVDAVELSGVRADVYIATAAPYQLLLVQLKSTVEVDGLFDAILSYSNVGKDFAIKAPTDVIDFANLSTLPPVYTVVSVDTTACQAPCVVSAKVKNLGGIEGAKAPSWIEFVAQAPGGGAPTASCTATIQPDVGYNATITVSCTLNISPSNAQTVTASAHNPGRA